MNVYFVFVVYGFVYVVFVYIMVLNICEFYGWWLIFVEK